MPAAPQPQPQEEILDAALAALTEADIPPTDEDVCRWPDPDTGRPAELAGLSDADLAELAAEAPAAPAPAWPVGYQCPDGPGGFAVAGRVRAAGRVGRGCRVCRWRGAGRAGRRAAAGRVR